MSTTAAVESNALTPNLQEIVDSCTLAQRALEIRKQLVYVTRNKDYIQHIRNYILSKGGSAPSKAQEVRYRQVMTGRGGRQDDYALVDEFEAALEHAKKTIGK